MPLSVNQQIDEYRIVRVIGQGGFGTVYLAHDTLLDRPAAIKELTITRQTDETAFKRFLQEARTAGSLNHPNIVTIYALKRHESNVYLVMEYVDGMSLRTLLEREGKLPIESAVEAAIHVCKGLSAAHAKGIVHRDLKPENILITSEGQIKVSDFGIAHVPRNAGGTTMTQVGFQPGTLIYMSPEQVLGRAVDARSDVYQIGELLYEMLAGKHYISLEGIEENARISTGNNMLLMQAKLLDLLSNAICRKPPTPLQPLRPDAPTELRAIIKSTLAKSPAQRPMNATELGQRLAHWLMAHTSSQAEFERLIQLGTTYAKQGRIDDAIREWQAALRINPDDVRPHLALAVFYKEQRRWDDAVREYQATLRISPDHNRVHFDLALIYAKQDRLNEAVRECQEVLRITPSAEAHALLAHIYDRLGRKSEAEAEEQIARKLGDAPTATPDQQAAKVHVQKGNDYLEQKQFDSAVAEYKLALQIELDNPIAHGHLGIAYDKKGQLDEAIGEWQEALSLAPFISSQRLNLARAYREKGRYEEAIHEFEEVTRSESKHSDPYLGKKYLAEAHYGLGCVYTDQGRFDDATHDLQEALRLAPNNAEYHRCLGWVFESQGHYDEAIREYQETIHLDPSNSTAHDNLGYVYWRQGRLDDAIQEYQKELNITPDDDNAHVNLGIAYRDLGQVNDAVQEFQTALRLNANNDEAHYEMGVTYRQLGQIDDAIAEAQIALKLGRQSASQLLDELQAIKAEN